MGPDLENEIDKTIRFPWRNPVGDQLSAQGNTSEGATQGAMTRFFALLVAFCLVASSYQEEESYCKPDANGLCTWTNPILCKNPEQYCGSVAECLIVTKSITSSNSSPSGANQQFQCRCPVDADACKPYGDDQASSMCSSNREIIYIDSNFKMSIPYAEMWKCSDDSAINSAHCSIQRQRIGEEFGCKGDAQLLPNVLALVRFWCQNKTTCQFDPSLVLSHVGSPNNTLSLPANYVFEWAQASIENSTTFSCSKQSTQYGDSCYRMTPSNLEWIDARSYCLRLGGDLALFTSQINFASVLQTLDSSIPFPANASKAIPTWFKWYSWDGEQRIPQHFMQYTDGFQCDVYDYQNEIGRNPLARCYAGKRTKKARGLCVLPPFLPSENFEYENITCPARSIPGYEDYRFEETAVDSIATKSCPTGFNGEARWACGINGQWMTPSPDLSNCTNLFVDESVNQAKEDLKSNNKSPSEALNSLSQAVKKENIASGNIAQIDETIRLAIEKQEEFLNFRNAETQQESCENFTKSVLDLNDYLLGSDKAFWGLDSIPREEAIDHIQSNIDYTLFLLAQNLVSVDVYRIADFSNITVQVENKEKTDYKNKTYTYVAGDKDQLILPAGFPYAVNDSTLACNVYPTFQHLLHGDALALLDEATAPLRQVLVSKVVGASLGQPMGSTDLKGGKVEILLSTLNLDLYDVDKSSAKCAYWDVSIQGWSFDGCELVYTMDKSTTRCRCDHLTNFAVLMDINGLFQNKTIPALDYITVIGESISIICLTLALVIFYSFRNLRRDFRFHVHRNLCLNLLIAEILLLAGIDATQNSGLCLSIAVFLHLFFLCAFGWMLVEGLYMYFLVTKVFEGSGLKRWQYYIIGYGFPILVVSITLIATNAEAYKNDFYCWLSYENGAIWSFAAPVAGIVLANCVFLVVALVVAFKSKRNKRSKKEERSIKWIFGTASLTFILGITWLFGFLYFNEGSMVMAYTFTILNSLQGVMIFITFCILNKQVRNELHRKIISHKGAQRVASVFKIKLSGSHVNTSQNSANKSGTTSLNQTSSAIKTIGGPSRKVSESNEYH